MEDSKDDSSPSKREREGAIGAGSVTQSGSFGEGWVDVCLMERPSAVGVKDMEPSFTICSTGSSK